jgi:putative FmdB family regulatory protein
MPIYDYLCVSCNSSFTYEHPIDDHDQFNPGSCVHCRTPLRRTYKTVQFARVMQEYEHPQFGTVSSPRGISDAAKRAGEAASIRTGIHHNYLEADPTDAAAVGVTGKGLEDTARRKRELGLPEPKTPFT